MKELKLEVLLKLIKLTSENKIKWKKAHETNSLVGKGNTLSYSAKFRDYYFIIYSYKSMMINEKRLYISTRPLDVPPGEWEFPENERIEDLWSLILKKEKEHDKEDIPGMILDFLDTDFS